MLIPALLLLFVVWILLIAFSSKLKKYGFRVWPGLLMWHTKRGLRFMDRVANAWKKGWIAFGTVGAAIGLFLMVFVFVAIVSNAAYTLARLTEARLAETVPGVQVPLPGLMRGLSIPSWLVAVASVLLVHEFAHGFLLRAQGLKAKSVGGMVLVALPGAFVEHDEKQLMETPIPKRLRVFGAGSFANLLFAFLCLGIILLSLTPLQGLYVQEVVEGSSADNAGLREGMRLLRLDGNAIERYEEFHDFMKNTKPGQEILVSTDRENFLIKLASRPDNENVGFLGIGVHWTAGIPASSFTNPLTVMNVMFHELIGWPIFHSYAYHSPLPWGVIDAVKWMFVLNLGIGLFNLLPAVPFDGGYMVQSVIERASSKRVAKRVVRVFSCIVLVLVIVNFLPHFA